MSYILLVGVTSALLHHLVETPAWQWIIAMSKPRSAPLGPQRAD
jgi:hypothetical protein